MAKQRAKGKGPQVQVEAFGHPTADNASRPEIGTQARFTLKKPAQTYRYDSSLAPTLEWDGQNPAREEAEALIRQILDAASVEEAKAAAEKLRRMSGPFLNWAGKAERQAFDVPTLPLFIHERLSTKAIVEALRSHRRAQQGTLYDLLVGQSGRAEASEKPPALPKQAGGRGVSRRPGRSGSAGGRGSACRAGEGLFPVPLGCSAAVSLGQLDHLGVGVAVATGVLGPAFGLGAVAGAAERQVNVDAVGVAEDEQRLAVGVDQVKAVGRVHGGSLCVG
jgi:hypothetical protein